MSQTPLQPNYTKVFIQRDYSEGKKALKTLKLCKISPKIFIFLNSRMCGAVPKQVS